MFFKPQRGLGPQCPICDDMLLSIACQGTQESGRRKQKITKNYAGKVIITFYSIIYCCFKTSPSFPKGPFSIYGGYRTANLSNGGAKKVIVPYGKCVKNIAVPYGSQAKKSLCPVYETDAIGHCILQLGVWGRCKPPSRSRAVPCGLLESLGLR